MDSIITQETTSFSLNSIFHYKLFFYLDNWKDTTLSGAMIDTQLSYL